MNVQKPSFNLCLFVEHKHFVRLLELHSKIKQNMVSVAAAVLVIYSICFCINRVICLMHWCSDWHACPQIHGLESNPGRGQSAQTHPTQVFILSFGLVDKWVPRAT